MVVEVIVIAVQNRVILHVIALSPIHAVGKVVVVVVVRQINMAKMMIEIR